VDFSMGKFLIFLLLNINFYSFVFADIRKNKTIQETVGISVENQRYNFNIQNLLICQETFNAFITMLEERYKKEKIDGVIVCSSEAELCYGALAKKLDIPLIFIDFQGSIPPLKENGRYIIGEPILEEHHKMEKVLKICEAHRAFVMEISCITEVLYFKAREKLNAQIMSIFINRKTQNLPSQDK
jgi:hypothetical protein